MTIEIIFHFTCFIIRKRMALNELYLLIAEEKAVNHRLILKILASRRWQFVAVGAVNDSFLHRYNKRPRSRTMTKGGTRTKDERGVEAEPDERPQSVKMRNDARMTPRRRVGGYCSAERPEISRERSLEESTVRLDSHERSRSYRESGNSRTPIKWTCSVREIKEKGSGKTRWFLLTTDIKGCEEDKSEIMECKNERKKYLSPCFL